MRHEYIVNTYKHRQIDLLGEYYRQIMILKNQTVKNNLERMYKISNCHILNSDLGIDRSTWESAYSNKTIL